MEEQPTIIEDVETNTVDLPEQTPVPPVEENPWTYIVVKGGDTLERLTDINGHTQEEIIDRNKINPDFVFAGHGLWV